MQRRDVLKIGLVLPATGWVSIASAHHGWSSFDQDRPLYLEGRVTKVVWQNPHAELELELPAALRLPPDSLSGLCLRSQRRSMERYCWLRRSCQPVATNAGKSSWHR
jgi:hypothetical protein